MDFMVLARVLEAGLSLWASKEKTKYRDRLMSLRKDYYDEYNKPKGKRSDARLDELHFELRNLASGFTSAVGASDPTAK